MAKMSMKRYKLMKPRLTPSPPKSKDSLALPALSDVTNHQSKNILAKTKKALANTVKKLKSRGREEEQDDCTCDTWVEIESFVTPPTSVMMPVVKPIANALNVRTQAVRGISPPAKRGRRDASAVWMQISMMETLGNLVVGDKARPLEHDWDSALSGTRSFGMMGGILLSSAIDAASSAYDTPVDSKGMKVDSAPLPGIVSADNNPADDHTLTLKKRDSESTLARAGTLKTLLTIPSEGSIQACSFDLDESPVIEDELSMLQERPVQPRSPAILSSPKFPHDASAEGHGQASMFVLGDELATLLGSTSGLSDELSIEPCSIVPASSCASVEDKCEGPWPTECQDFVAMIGDGRVEKKDDVEEGTRRRSLSSFNIGSLPDKLDTVDKVQDTKLGIDIPVANSTFTSHFSPSDDAVIASEAVDNEEFIRRVAALTRELQDVCRDCDTIESIDVDTASAPSGLPSAASLCDIASLSHVPYCRCFPFHPAYCSGQNYDRNRHGRRESDTLAQRLTARREELRALCKGFKPIKLQPSACRTSLVESNSSDTASSPTLPRHSDDDAQCRCAKPSPTIVVEPAHKPSAAKEASNLKSETRHDLINELLDQLTTRSSRSSEGLRKSEDYSTLKPATPRIGLKKTGIDLLQRGRGGDDSKGLQKPTALAELNLKRSDTHKKMMVNSEGGESELETALRRRREALDASSKSYRGSTRSTADQTNSPTQVLALSQKAIGSTERSSATRRNPMIDLELEVLRSGCRIAENGRSLAAVAIVRRLKEENAVR